MAALIVSEMRTPYPNTGVRLSCIPYKVAQAMFTLSSSRPLLRPTW
jgi:hypothetical protein